jgi:hypothetical protein
MKLPKEILEQFKTAGSAGGRIGGKIAASNMTPEQRRARSQKALAVRWGKNEKKS